ncbi:DNA (cytosine-5-)-methyltransferase [Anaerovoracaceae bacterium 41-7]
MIQILELFGGIGAPRAALRNMGIPVKSIDYVEIDESAVRSYNAMFAEDLQYKTQDITGWNLKPDILIHGSPCQDFSIAGHQGNATAAKGRINRGKGADEGTGTRSSLMWETVHIIEQMGEWKPKYVIWENVKNVLSKHMKHNFVRYIEYLSYLGYTSNYKILDARDFGLPQARQRVFTVSVLNGSPFDFGLMEKRPMQSIDDFLEHEIVDECYLVTQPSVYTAIGKTGIRRATIIKDYCNTITTRQDRTPAQVIDIGSGNYRYLTEKECWRLQGYSDKEFHDAERAIGICNGKMNRTLYKQAGNSIPVPIFESMFKVMI